MTEPAYCTILARNYLPKALTLSDSLRRHGSQIPLTVFVTDAVSEAELPDVLGVRWMTPSSLDLPERTMLAMAMSYDLVEFATSVKPLVLRKLLEEHERAGYLDPDTYVTSPMMELVPALDASAGILLTPHYLEPTPSGSQFSDGHLLAVGVYNLGFCLVSRAALGFLAWWWGHLSHECLHDPIAGLFVDQKWVDVGSVLFGAASLRHYGYNVSVANLHERPVSRDDDGFYIASNGDRLRLFHFHAFSTSRPQELSTRMDASTAHLRADNSSIDALCKEYAAALIDNEVQLGPPPPYRYGADTTGRRITRRMRHAYRVALRSDPTGVPSPFVATEAQEYEKWRRGAWRLAGQLMLADVAKGVRCALPEEYAALKRRLPGLTKSLRKRYADDSGMWG